jgi:DNA-binding MarR family transcriptional regulator
MTMNDIVKELGLLTLGTRLKRLGERLQAQTQDILDAHGAPAPAAHQPALAALDRLGPLTVGELALALGISQPGATRQLNQLQAAGLVQAQQSSADLRLRTVALTALGREHVALARLRVWPAVEVAVANACEGTGPALLAHLDALEAALADLPLSRRAHHLSDHSAADEAASGATHAAHAARPPA